MYRQSEVCHSTASVHAALHWQCCFLEMLNTCIPKDYSSPTSENEGIWNKLLKPVLGALGLELFKNALRTLSGVWCLIYLLQVNCHREEHRNTNMHKFNSELCLLLNFQSSTKLTICFCLCRFHTWLDSAVCSKLGFGAGFINYRCLTSVNFK